MEMLVKPSGQLEKWYESFRSRFLAIGLTLGYKKEELADIINQFFLDLLEKNIDTRDISSPEAYLTTAFRRRLIDYHRRSVVKPAFTDTDSIIDNYTVPSAQDMLERAQENLEQVHKIKTAYNKLPKRCRKVIYLKFYEELNADQIALRTGLNKRTVYNNLFEGIKLLRRELQQTSGGLSLSVALPLLAVTLAGCRDFF